MAKAYDPAYKLAVCKQIESGSATVAEISRETGINENTLYNWMKRYRANREKPFVGSGHILPENEEMVRLRRENKDLREENEILKNAAAYFAKHLMCGDTDTAKFLQKAIGYCLTGGTDLECFFILHGATTRNGKSTLTGTIEYILSDYARSVQPQTLSRRPSDGASPSPDIARLKVARLVNMPEPEKGLELNVALIKQLTGGDTYTGRFLHENPVEFIVKCA